MIVDYSKIKLIAKNILFFSLSFVVYCLISLFLWGLPKNLGGEVLGLGDDPLQYIWGIKWVLYSFENHINPIITFKQVYPAGSNLSWSVGNSFTADFLSLPITLKLGAIFSYNIWVILSPVLASMSALILFYYLTRNYFAAFIGGYMYGFSSYELGQLLGHLNLFGGTFIIPILLLISILLYQDKINKMLYMLIYSFLLILLFGFSLEIFTSLTLFSYISVLIAFLILKEERKAIFRLGKYLTISYIITSIILVPYFYFLYLGLPFIEVFNDPSIFSADLLNYIIPTPITLIGGSYFEKLASRFSGNFSEEGAYIGLPLLLVTYIYIKKETQTKIKKLILSVLTVMVIFSLGPYVHILGHHTLPSPYWLVTKLPIIANMLPTRFTLYTALLFSLIETITLSRLVKGYQRYILGFLIILFLLPNFKLYKQIITKYKVPNIFNTKICDKYIYTNDDIFIIPFNNLNGLYQVKSNLCFNMTNSAFDIIIPARKWPWLDFLRRNNIFTESTPTIIDYKIVRSFIGTNKINYIIVTKNYYNGWKTLLNLSLNTKPEFVEGVYLYKVPNSILNNPKYRSLTYMKESIIYSNIAKFTYLFNAAIEFLYKQGSISKLYPTYLEEYGYLDKSFGHHKDPHNNWTKDGGWIGGLGCPDGKGECFGVGVVGTINEVKPIIEQYKSQAVEIYFPYPKIYNSKDKNGNGQLLMIFRAPKPKPVISHLPYIVDFKSTGNAKLFELSGFCKSENWGTWSCAKEVTINFDFTGNVKTPLFLKLYFNALATPSHLQTFDFYLNDNLIKQLTFNNNNENQVTFDISKIVKAHNTFVIQIPDATTPKSLGINADTRLLGIGLIKLIFTDNKNSIK